MKQYLFLIITLLFSSVTFGQVQSVDKQQSNIEKFSGKSGTLIEKQFTDIANVKAVKVQVLILTDLITSAKISGVRLEYDVVDRYTSDSKTAFLDKDEIDGLIASINALKQKVFNTTKENYTEVVYTSRTGFTAGAYFNKGQWSGFMKLERYDSKSFVTLATSDFDTLLAALISAKEKI